MPHLTLTLTTHLAASADEVWAHASGMDGVNAELRPWVRMTVPAAVRGGRITDVEPGVEAFTSTLLALGVLPFDRHHLTIERVHERGAERGFDEESWTWLQRRWRHERRVAPLPRPDGDTADGRAPGCVVTDRLTISPRLAPAFLVRPLVRALFRHRHRQLIRLFGSA